MDLSIQKMQPPASVQGKSAAKKRSSSGFVSEDDAIGSTEREQKTRFAHGNTGYEASNQDDQLDPDASEDEKRRSKGSGLLLSEQDLSQLAFSMEVSNIQQRSADGLMNLRAYKAATSPHEPDDELNVDRNI